MMMRKEFTIKGLSDDIKSREIEEFYDPFKTTQPIKHLANRPSTACVTLFDD